MWASVGGVLAPEKREFTPEETAMADQVCEGCALWDGTPEKLTELRFGAGWQIAMSVISRGEPCWDDVMRVCDAIVRREGNFISSYLGKSGAIYTPDAISQHRGRVRGDTLTFPDDQGMYRDDEPAGDPWDSAYERRSAWSVA